MKMAQLVKTQYNIFLRSALKYGLRLGAQIV